MMIRSAHVRIQMLASLLMALLISCGARAADSAVTTMTPQQQHQLLHEAQQAYDRGIDLLPRDPAAARQFFTDAAARFQLIIDGGVANAPLHYNLANAYFQSGDLGRAIFNYRLAERYTLWPGTDARLASNLAAARAQCRSPIAANGQRELLHTLLSVHHLPLSIRFNAFLILNAAFWLGMLVVPWRSGGGRWVLTPVLLLWLLAGMSVAADLTGFGRMSFGVLVSNEVVVRKGNGAGFEPQFQQPLHAGVEFFVREKRGEWLRIELSDGQEGWIEADGAVLAWANPGL